MTTLTLAAVIAALILFLHPRKNKTVACTNRGEPAGARVESAAAHRDQLRNLFTGYRRVADVCEACTRPGCVADRCG
jgi:hypothetical protein